MKNIFYMLVCYALLLSCENNNKSIMKSIFNDALENNKSEIDLYDYTNFEWDTVYIFQVPVSLEEINKTIGIDYNHYIEFSRPIIFVKNKKIVFSENERGNLEGISEGQLIYKDPTNKEKYLIRTRSTSKLKTQIKQEGKVKYLLLN